MTHSCPSVKALDEKEQLQIHLEKLDEFQKQGLTEELTFYVGEYTFSADRLCSQC